MVGINGFANIEMLSQNLDLNWENTQRLQQSKPQHNLHLKHILYIYATFFCPDDCLIITFGCMFSDHFVAYKSQATFIEVH